MDYSMVHRGELVHGLGPYFDGRCSDQGLQRRGRMLRALANQHTSLRADGHDEDASFGSPVLYNGSLDELVCYFREDERFLWSLGLGFNGRRSQDPLLGFLRRHSYGDVRDDIPNAVFLGTFCKCEANGFVDKVAPFSVWISLFPHLLYAVVFGWVESPPTRLRVLTVVFAVSDLVVNSQVYIVAYGPVGALFLVFPAFGYAEAFGVFEDF